MSERDETHQEGPDGQSKISRRKLLKTIGVGTAGLIAASLPLVANPEHAYAAAISFYNALDYPTVQDAVNAAAAAGGGAVLFPAGTYAISANMTIPANVDLQILNGAILNIGSGVSLTVNGGIVAGLYRIFTGSGSAVLANARIDRVYPEWWMDGSGNDGPAIAKALNAHPIVHFSAKEYVITTTVTIPQAKTLQMVGSGYRSTSFIIAPGITAFHYVRSVGLIGTLLSIHEIGFLQNGGGKTSIGLTFQGNSQAHDNWLRMYDCYFYGLARGVSLKYCGFCHFEGCMAQANNVVYFLERDSSFIWFNRCMNLDNYSFIYADDPLADGISNGIFIDNCSSVFAFKEDIRIVGWQTVYITGGGGVDLGGAAAGVAAIYLNSCQDFSIRDMWIASDKTTMTNRSGVHLVNCHSGIIDGCSLVNNTIGIRVEGNAGYSTRLTINGNKFEANVTNDILFVSNVKAAKVVNNHFMSTVSRTGTNYEVYANTAGSNYNIIKQNTFTGSSYPIISGANSVVGDNIFGVPN